MNTPLAQIQPQAYETEKEIKNTDRDRYMNTREFWSSEILQHQECMKNTANALFEDFENFLEACTHAIKNGKKIMFFGNGGSAADAQHLATELAVRYINDRAPISSVALTTDTSTLTAAGNDYGFEHIFSRQIEAIGNEGDIVVAISTSGKSPNIIRALESAKEKKLITVGLSGRDGGFMPPFCDHMLIVPSESTARIQEMHILIGHMLCGGLEKSLGLVD